MSAIVSHTKDGNDKYMCHQTEQPGFYVLAKEGTGKPITTHTPTSFKPGVYLHSQGGKYYLAHGVALDVLAGKEYIYYEHLYDDPTHATDGRVIRPLQGDFCGVATDGSGRQRFQWVATSDKSDEYMNKNTS